jgi:hypothetical protein
VSLARVSGALLIVAAIALLLIGVPSFVAPTWAASEFPWTVGPFLAQTIGGWSIGTALICLHAARLRSPARSYPLLVYAWLFGIGQLLVVFVFLDRFLAGHVLAWPYLIGLLALVASAAAGIAAFTRAERAGGAGLLAVGHPVPRPVRVIGVFVGLFVLLLAIGTLLAGPTGAIATGTVFPEPMGLFSIRAFSAFLFAIAAAIAAVLLGRSVEPYEALGWAGFYLIVPITLAALLNLSVFDFGARPGGLLYILAYVVVGLVIAAALVWLRRRRAAEVGVATP